MINIKRIHGYQASDGKSFCNQEDAIKYEFHLNLRGLVQQSFSGQVKDSYTGFQVAKVIADKLEQIEKLNKEFKRALNMANRYKSKDGVQNKIKEDVTPAFNKLVSVL